MKEKEKNQKNGRLNPMNSESAPVTLDADMDEKKTSPKQGKTAGSAMSLGATAIESENENKTSPIQPSLTEELVAHENHGRARKETVSTALILGLLAGLVGGAFGGVYLAPWLQGSFIGVVPANQTETRRVVLDENSAVIDVVKEVNPAVVSIIISKDLPKVEQYYVDPFGEIPPGFPFSFNSPGGGSGLQQIGAGSGFIVTSDGLILTNKHVVADDKAEYTVITFDGKKYAGRVLARDPLNDLAVIKIDAQDLPIAQLGDSSKVELGQRVIAIGNTLGELSNTVTTGIISGVGRTVTAGDSQGGTEQLQEVFQTDAAINPGNSGGPLLNLAGQVIGVNTAIDQSGQLVGFAIPSSEAAKVLGDVQKYGRVLRPFVGVRYVIINADYAKTNELKADHGALIIRGKTAGESAIVAGSPAEKAGLREDDIILEVNGKSVDEDSTLSNVLKTYKPGDQVVLKIQRGDEAKDILLTLGEA